MISSSWNFSPNNDQSVLRQTNRFTFILIYIYIFIVIYIYIYITIHFFYSDLEQQLLIRNTITDVEPECNKPCGKHRCNVCKHINTATKVFINPKTVKPDNHNCDSAYVVHLIHCKNALRHNILEKRRKFQIPI